MKYNNVYKYRDIWMAFAILWIVVYHMDLQTDIMPLNVFLKLGYGGCDVLLFASGIGQYCSLDHNDELLAYYKRRFLRLMPMYWCFMIFWLGYRFWAGTMTIKGALGNIFCLSFFATQEYDFNWYLPLLWICYLLAPLWKKVIDRYPSFRSLVMVLLLIIIMEVPFWGRAMDMMAYTRLPIFYAGMWFGQYADSEKDIKKSHKIAWILAAFPSAAVAYYFVCIRPGIGWNMGLNWYPFLGIVPGICFLLSWICDILAATRMRGLLSFGSFIGKHSLEIYLVHVLFFEIYKDYIRPNNIVVHRTRNWLVLLLLTAIGCVCLHYMEQGVRTAFKKLADRSKTE